MKEQLIEFETAELAKEKGFDYRVLIDRIPFLRISAKPCPQSVLQQWFRKKHKLHIQIDIGHDQDKIWYDFYIMKIEKGYNFESLGCSESGLNSYEKALEEALKMALKII